MQPDWLKSPNDDYWMARLDPYPYKGSVARTMFGSFSWSVSDAVHLQRAGNVGTLGTLEAAQTAAEDAAGEFSTESG